jgi:mercuric ion binding protein
MNPDMKKTALLALLLGGAVMANAQQPKAQTIVVKSENLRCWECKERLDKYLIRENKASMESGIASWKYNLLQATITFTFLPDRTSAEAIRAALNNAGFDADGEKAEPEAYQKLPPICKRPEDGGGPQKNKPCHVQPMQ